MRGYFGICVSCACCGCDFCSPAASPHQHSAAALSPPCRPVQPRTFGVAHIAAVNVLVVLGAFCAALLAASYNSQVVQWKVSLLCRVEHFIGWNTGMLGLHVQVHQMHGLRCRHACSCWSASQ